MRRRRKSSFGITSLSIGIIILAVLIVGGGIAGAVVATSKGGAKLTPDTSSTIKYGCKDSNATNFCADCTNARQNDCQFERDTKEESPQIQYACLRPGYAETVSDHAGLFENPLLCKTLLSSGSPAGSLPSSSVDPTLVPVPVSAVSSNPPPENPEGCGAGEFLQEVGGYCQRISDCSSGETEYKAATATSDRLCRKTVRETQPGGTFRCAEGYDYLPNDIPGFGAVNGKGGNQLVSSCAECAGLCDGEETCAGYECSPSDLGCSLFPSSGLGTVLDKYLDYNTCTKIDFQPQGFANLPPSSTIQGAQVWQHIDFGGPYTQVGTPGRTDLNSLLFPTGTVRDTPCQGPNSPCWGNHGRTGHSHPPANWGNVSSLKVGSAGSVTFTGTAYCHGQHADGKGPCGVYGLNAPIEACYEPGETVPYIGQDKNGSFQTATQNLGKRCDGTPI